MTSNTFNSNTDSQLTFEQHASTQAKLKNALLKVAIIAGIYLFTGAVVKANDEAESAPSEQKPSVSSIAVNYEGHPHKIAQSKFEGQKNEAQSAAFTVLNKKGELDKATSTLSSNLSDDLLFKTRDEVQAFRKNQQARTSNSILNATTSSNSNTTKNYVEFGIYGASTVLFDDEDFDGFYQTFSVTFDADVYGAYAGERARVFADLYLSRDGGPWQLYFTTEAFTIIDDNTDDEFEVLTTLNAGYLTDNYDVLIDVYEVGYSDVVATISSEDVDSLYALPLESSDRDVYVEVQSSTSVSISAGSTTGLTVAILSAIVLMRRFSSRRPN